MFNKYYCNFNKFVKCYHFVIILLSFCHHFVIILFKCMNHACIFASILKFNLYELCIVDHKCDPTMH
jgi:hypothetical protein